MSQAACCENLRSLICLPWRRYVGQIDGDQLRLTLTVEATLFGDAWQIIPIPIGGLRVEAIGAENSSARIRRSDNPDLLHWHLHGAGNHALTLELSTSLVAQGSDRAAAFSLSGAPSGQLELALPPGKFVRVNGRSIPVQIGPPAPAKEPDAVAAEEAEPSRSVVVPVGGAATVTLLFTDRDSESQTDTLTLAQTAMGVYAAPGEVTWTARTSLHVAGRQLNRLLASVPNSVEITNVESIGLESWELGDDPAAAGRTLITLNYRQPFDGGRRITFQGVLASRPDENAQDDEWSVPTLQLKEVTSHVGSLTIQHPLGVRLLLLGESGASIQAAETGAAPPAGTEPVASTGQLEATWYRFWEEEFSLRFRTVAKVSEIHAAMSNQLIVNDSGLHLHTAIDISTLFVPLFELQRDCSGRVRSRFAADGWCACFLGDGLSRGGSKRTACGIVQADPAG